MDTAVIGRDAELAVIERAFEQAARGTASLVWVQGPAGSGKSALIDAAVARFHDRDDGPGLVWRVTCDAPEQLIEHAISEQLLRLSDDVPDAGGFRLEEETRPHHVAVELLRRLSERAREATVLLVVDDAHWCDHSSRQSIRFLLRRIEHMRVAVIVAQRPTPGGPDGPERLRGPMRLERIDLHGLSVDGVRQLMAARGIPLTPRAGKRLHTHTAGSPQLIVALASELSREVLSAGEGALPAPASFTDWVSRVYTEAGADVRSVVAAVTVVGAPTPLPMLRAMTGCEGLAEAVDSGIELGLLRMVSMGQGRLVDVEHALVRSAVQQSMGFAEHQLLQQRASELVGDPVLAMLHRLQASVEHDAQLAAEAVELAEQQVASGAVLASARLLTLAAAVVPPARRQELLLRGAAQLLRIGEVRWAQQVLEAVERERQEEPSAAELLVAGHLATQLGDPARARSMLGRAYEAGTDPRVVAGAAELLAYLNMDAGAGEEAHAWALRALEAADPDQGALECAGTVLVSAGALLDDLAGVRSVLQRHIGRFEGTDSLPDITLGLALAELWTGRHGQADELLTRLRDPADGGAAVLRTTTRLAQAELDYRTGRWDAVLATTDSDLALVDEGWDTRVAPMTLAVGAYVCAARGEYERAEAFIVRAESLIEGISNLPSWLMTRLARARMALAMGDPDRVVNLLLPLAEPGAAGGIPEGVHAWRADLAEALLAIGLADEAGDVLESAELDDDPHAATGLLRVRAGHAVAVGDTALAEELHRRAVEPGARASGAFVHARALLAAGAFTRRQGRRREAAGLLEEALAGLTELGAAPFAEQARMELQLCALRRSASDAQKLTPAEEAVARLVVAGHTNKEIAGTLVVSIKTVESHLGRIFSKLGVRHRVELVTLLAARGRRLPPGSGPSGEGGSR